MMKGQGSKVKGQRLPSCLVSFTILLFFFTPSFAADLTNLKVTSSVKPSEIRIGEGIEFKITVEHDKGIDIFYPDESAQLAPFEVVKHKVSARNTAFGSNLTEIVYTVTTFETGSFIVPAILITAKDRVGNEKNVRTIEHKVAVTTGTTVGSEILDIVPPMDITEQKEYLKQAARYLPYLALLLIIVIGTLYLQRSRPKVQIVKADSRTKALQRLGMLKVEEVGIDRLYFDIAEIMRVFLQEHLNLDSLRMTSEEVLKSLRQFEGMNKIIGEAEEMFFDLDLVKFSPFSPTSRDGKEAVSRAEGLIGRIP